MTKNRHPVDELADVRGQIKSLQERESVLRDDIIKALPERLTPDESQTVYGDEHSATVSVSTRETLDRAKVAVLLSKPKLQSCLKSSTAITIRVSARDRQQEAA